MAPIFAASELGELADRLASEYEIRFDAEPIGAAAEFEEDVLTFSFEGGLQAEESLLLDRERMVELRERRERRMEPMGARLAVPVEEFAGSRVAFHVGLFDPYAGSTTMLFGFEDALSAGSGEGRGQLLDWSARVRGEARRLRREHVAAREAHLQIFEQFQAERARLAEGFRDEDGD